MKNSVMLILCACAMMMSACAPAPDASDWNIAEPTLRSAEDAGRTEFTEQDLH